LTSTVLVARSTDYTPEQRQKEKNFFCILAKGVQIVVNGKN